MARKGSEVADVRYVRIKVDDDRYKSILFKIGDKDVWLPRSQIEVDKDSRVVTAPVWLIEEKGIEGEVV